MGLAAVGGKCLVERDLDFGLLGAEKDPGCLAGKRMQGVEYETIKAEVPGNVELDLLAAGLVENPEIGSNVYLLRPYEGCQWRYSRKFVSPERSDEDEVAIHFGGIDCYAEIYLNGRHIGSASNMLIDYEYDVTDAVAAPGEENLLEVYIRSSVIEGRRNVPPVISYNFAQLESVYSRRAPHTYGWDIMPRLVSAGLWRDVTLEVKSPVHIVDTHWYTVDANVKERTASVYLDYTITLPVKYQDGAMTAEITISKDGVEKRKMFKEDYLSRREGDVLVERCGLLVAEGLRGSRLVRRHIQDP